MMDTHITYIIVIGFMILDESKSRCDERLDDGDNDNSTELYRCEEGFVLTEYVIRNCTQGTCENECFEVSNQTTHRHSFEHLHIDVNEVNITLKCSTGPITMMLEFMGCTNDSFIRVIPQCLSTDVTETQTTECFSVSNQTTIPHSIAHLHIDVNNITLKCSTGPITMMMEFMGCTNDSFIGVKPQCLSTDVTQTQTTDRTNEASSKLTDLIKLILIISVAVAGSISLCSTVIIICCCSKPRQNTRRGPHNDKTIISQQLSLDNIDINSHISTASTNNVGLTDENGAMTNIPTSPPNNPETFVKLATFFNNAAETVVDYETIDQKINPKSMATGNGEPFMDMLDSTDAAYDRLHAKEAPPSNDNYSDLKEIHETTDYEPEYTQITKWVKEPVTNTNTDEQIEDSTYDLTATQSRSESDNNIKSDDGTEVETENTIQC